MFYMIDKPALAYPATVLSNASPDALAENTSKSLVCAVTAILNPVVIPLLRLPIAIVPVSGGDSVTIAPGIGEKILFGVADAYNCA